MTKIDKIQIWIAWHLPKWIVTWCISRAFEYSTTQVSPKINSSDLLVTTMMDDWHNK